MSSSDEIELENVLEISQVKILRNFASVARSMARHEARLQEQQASFELATMQLQARLDQLEKYMGGQLEKIDQRCGHLEVDVSEQHRQNEFQNSRIGGLESSQALLKEELFTTQSQFEDKANQQSSLLTAVQSTLENVHLEQKKCWLELERKEEKATVAQVMAQHEKMAAKQTHLESEIKLNVHKVETLEILSEKASRERPKKEKEFAKEVEDKILAQVRAMFNLMEQSILTKVCHEPSPQTPPARTPSASSACSTPAPLPTALLPAALMPAPPERAEPELTQTFFRMNIENSLVKCQEKIQTLASSLKDLEETVKALGRSSAAKKTSEKESQSGGILDRLNEIKPELSKLWAKLDTLDDRISFNERKLEEKNKVVGELAVQLKENSKERLEEKLKSLQNELYGSIKEVKAKLEGRVKSGDYEKHMMIVNDRLKQAEDVLMLKSDKLEVKKGLLFLESKIKEIILVISEDDDQDKDALLTRKQIKCISCDKELDKLTGAVSSPKGNWDAFPLKDHPPEILGRFGMTNFGSLAKKIRKIEGRELPQLNRSAKHPSSADVSAFK